MCHIDFSSFSLVYVPRVIRAGYEQLEQQKGAKQSLRALSRLDTQY